MYNLFISANSEFYDHRVFEMDSGRAITEYTDKNFKQKYGDLSDAAIKELMSFPCLFGYENGVQKSARLGWITRIQKRQSSVRIEFKFDDSALEIVHTKMYELKWVFDIGEWELNRHHWAVKDVDLIEVLVDLKLLASTRQTTHAMIAASEPAYTIQPRIFHTPTAPRDKNLVSVMMPFAGFDHVYKAIAAAVKAVGFDCARADQVWESSEIIQDIFALIYRSQYVICDFTGSNPNVFYEAGIAHTLGREVIPLAQSTGDVPFDLRHHRYIRYLNNQEGLGDLSRQLSARMDFLRKQAAS